MYETIKVPCHSSGYIAIILCCSFSLMVAILLLCQPTLTTAPATHADSRPRHVDDLRPTGLGMINPTQVSDGELREVSEVFTSSSDNMSMNVT